MKQSPFRLRVLLAAIVLPACALHAQAPPPLLNYQGRVVVGSENFDGTGQFRFALVSGNGLLTFWSNSEDTTPADGVPDAAVSVPVTKGLYSVILGDTGVANMAGVPFSVFINPDVRLRVWFDDGVNGVQLLTPDQRITAAGYAVTAAGVNLPATSGSTSSTAQGVIRQDGSRLVHTSSPTSSDNFFAGRNAGNFTVQGGNNTGVGPFALQANGSAIDNTAIGALSLAQTVDGSYNVAAGSTALQANTGGYYNTAIGYHALAASTLSSNNTAVGAEALSKTNTLAGSNTGVGSFALYVNTVGASNTALGASALVDNVDGSRNTAIGDRALLRNTSGHDNTAVGREALDANETGGSNTALGRNALGANVAGQSNIAIGRDAGSVPTGGNNNIHIGNSGVIGDTGVIRIGNTPAGTRTFIGGIQGKTTGNANAIPVVIDSAGQLGTVSSSRRYKEGIEDMGDASERLYGLRPVSFRYSRPFDDGAKPVQFGLIAEEVAETFPELAVYNDEGEPETVKYQDLTPLLLNEVQKLRAEKDELRARLEKLEAIVNKGAAQ